MPSLEEKTAAWLREQGYPLEMRVAETLRAAGIHATHHRIYRDSTTGKVREIDVMGYLDQRQLPVHIVFECKHSNDKPWILFCSQAPLMRPLGYPLSVPCAPPAQDKMRRLAVQDTVQKMTMFDPSQLIGFRLVRAYTDNQDTAAHAICGLTSACRATAEDIGSHGHAVIYLPVVVVDAPLMKCYLPDATGELRLEVVPRGVLLHSHDLGEFTLIHVVHIDILKEFVAQVSADAATLGKLARRKHSPVTSSKVSGRSHPKRKS